VLASVALFFMPTSTSVLMAASLLWVLDASINISMEPFRAFVADKLDGPQRTAGFVMQSLFIGIGASLANALPWVLGKLGVAGDTPSGIPLTVKYAFQAGAVVFLLCVLWTVFTTSEDPPADMAAFEAEKRASGGVGHLVSEVVGAVRNMPATMKQLAVVQLFTWLGLFCMWIYFGPAVRGTCSAPRTRSRRRTPRGRSGRGSCSRSTRSPASWSRSRCRGSPSARAAARCTPGRSRAARSGC
jgi:maltose/moltooligosaccharide transporter